MSWLLNIKERTPVSIDGFHFSISPCRPDENGNFQSYACFIDLSHPLGEADRYRAMVALLDAIMEQGFEPNISPDRRPLPPLNGIKRCVGGHMIYANPIKQTLEIKPKEPKIETREEDILTNFGWDGNRHGNS